MITPHYLLPDSALKGVSAIDPLRDIRWPEFVRKHPAGSVFHTVPWLDALKRTYSYEPVALTTADGRGNLVSALAFCRINSWLTGKRMVSLPFSDHCEPLVRDDDELRLLLARLQRESLRSHCQYFEVRPKSAALSNDLGLWNSQSYCLHQLDLRRGAAALFEQFHRDCIQRKIRRAERECLTVTDGPPRGNLESFYRLVVKTRRRQGLPPQPFRWFANLVDCFGPAISIRVARKNGQCIAGMLTIQNSQCVTYKYGASDERYHNVGGMIYLLWVAIQDAICHGITEFDMGRSETDNIGLLTFKDRWGASRSTLSYWRFPKSQPPLSSSVSRVPSLVKQLCSYAPDPALVFAGNRFYRHIG